MSKATAESANSETSLKTWRSLDIFLFPWLSFEAREVLQKFGGRFFIQWSLELTKVRLLCRIWGHGFKLIEVFFSTDWLEVLQNRKVKDWSTNVKKIRCLIYFWAETFKKSFSSSV